MNYRNYYFLYFIFTDRYNLYFTVAHSTVHGDCVFLATNKFFGRQFSYSRVFNNIHVTK